MDTPTFLAPLPPARVARVVGRHRLRFLNAMTSMGLMKTEAGDCRFATMSTATGKHIGAMRLEIEAEALTLVAAASDFERLLAGLARHRIADDIRWEPAEAPRGSLGLFASSEAELEAAFSALFPGVSAPGIGRHVDLEGLDGLDGLDGGLRASRYAATFSELERPTIHLRVDEPSEHHLEAIAERAAAAGLGTMSQEAFEAARIRSLWPDGALDLPEEEPTLGSTRFIAAVDWDKGCFLGQEVFVMARDRGEPPKRLVAFTCDGAPPAPGTPVLNDKGGVAGQTGSAVAEDGQALLLALIKRRFAGPEISLGLEDGRLLQRV